MKQRASLTEWMYEFEQTPETVEDRGAWHAASMGLQKSDTTQSLLKWQLFQKDFSGHYLK